MLRLIALLVLLIVVALVLGISAPTSRLKDVVGAAILATVVVVTAAIGRW